MSKPDHYEEIFPRPLSGEKLTALPPALVPSRIPIPGQYVTLEPLDASRHAAALYEVSHASEQALKIWDYLTYGPWPDVEAYAQTLRAQSASFDPVFFAIRSNETGQFGGQASFLDIQAQNGVTEIGHIWFGPELQRTRAATEALFLMLCHAMDDLGYRRMQWRCNALNAKSRAAARRLGFRFEGIFYNNLIFKGMNRDTAWYSILDDEWPEVRQKIADWLDPSNFDAEGQAKNSLSNAMANRTPSTRRLE
jgi:RimJ/RimL family protein N-acetyltransferase